VTASRGKVLRAEPISAFYEQCRVHHVGVLPELEDQMHGFTNDFDRAKAGYSPDRVDALCFALSELLLGETCEAWLEFLHQDVVKRCGAIEGAKFAAMLEPKTANERSPRPTVTLHAPGPHIH
jgi:hypothetical protein